MWDLEKGEMWASKELKTSDFGLKKVFLWLSFFFGLFIARLSSLLSRGPKLFGTLTLMKRLPLSTTNLSDFGIFEQ